MTFFSSNAALKAAQKNRQQTEVVDTIELDIDWNYQELSNGEHVKGWYIRTSDGEPIGPNLYKDEQGYVRFGLAMVAVARYSKERGYTRISDRMTSVSVVLEKELP